MWRTFSSSNECSSGYVAEKEIKSGYVLGGEGALSGETVVEIFGTAAKTYAAEFVFELAEEVLVVENKIFTETVEVNGDNAQIIFTNCTFLGDVVNTADVGTRVLFLESRVHGNCVFDNDVKEATIETSLPKFLTDAPVNVIAEDCVGNTVAMGDFIIAVNGKGYEMKDAEWYLDANGDIVEYTGQEANYLYVAQWWENGEKVIWVATE